MMSHSHRRRQRLTSLRANVISKITASSPDGASASEKDLGGALHTLQDFYAHSNWVELGNAGIDSRRQISLRRLAAFSHHLPVQRWDAGRQRT